MHQALCKGLLNLFDKSNPKVANVINYLYSTDMLNTQILFLMNIIAKKEKEIQQSYMSCLIVMTNYISYYINFKVSDAVMDFFNSHGKAMKTTLEKRVYIYFCSQLLQLEYNYNPEIIKKLINIHTDPDKVVRREVAYQIRFIAKEKDVTFFIKNFINIIYFYFEEDDLRVKTEAIITSIKCLDRVYDEDSFIKKLCNVIIDLIQDDKLKYQDSSKKITRIIKTILIEAQEKIKIAQIMEKTVKAIFKVRQINK